MPPEISGHFFVPKNIEKIILNLYKTAFDTTKRNKKLSWPLSVFDIKKIKAVSRSCVPTVSKDGKLLI
jgi:hypothetical protein